MAYRVIMVVLLLMASCKKDSGDEEPDFVYEEQRITSIRNKIDGNSATFTYDTENKLSRIDFNYDGNLSVRFDYTLPTITAQYYKGAAPDITREKYTFTLLNGMVANYRMTRANGNIYDTYFEYDDSGRMIEAGQRGISNGNLFMTLDCYFSYNTQNNTQQIKLFGSRGLQASDTVVFTRTFDTERNYFTFHNIGFNYFGSFSTGVAYEVAGINPVILPFPFFTSEPFVDHFPNVPSTSPIKLLDGEGKARDFTSIFNNDWAPVSWHSVYPADYYKYDDMGRLAEVNSIYLFNWK
jgi:hypothetical protein